MWTWQRKRDSTDGSPMLSFGDDTQLCVLLLRWAKTSETDSFLCFGSVHPMVNLPVHIWHTFLMIILSVRWAIPILYKSSLPLRVNCNDYTYSSFINGQKTLLAMWRPLVFRHPLGSSALLLVLLKLMSRKICVIDAPQDTHTTVA